MSPKFSEKWRAEYLNLSATSEIQREAEKISLYQIQAENGRVYKQTTYKLIKLSFPNCNALM